MVRRCKWWNLRWLGFLSLLGLLEPFWPPFELFRLFALFFLLFPLEGILDIVRFLTGLRAQRKQGDVKAPVKAHATLYGLALLSSTLNPFVLIQCFAQIGGQVVAIRRRKGRLPMPETYRQRTVFTLPFEGAWTVANGGIDKTTSHSWELITQRYAYDFAVADASGKTYRNDGRRLEDYYAFGQPILAPADGRVVRVREGVRDYPSPRPVSGSLDWRTRDFRGNFVVIEHNRGEYSFLAHLQKGSVCVRPGDTVRRGQRIGACGNSGHSTEPHLHFHIQDHPNFFLAASLPVRFSHLQFVDNPDSEISSEAYLTQGQRVAPVTG